MVIPNTKICKSCNFFSGSPERDFPLVTIKHTTPEGFEQVYTYLRGNCKKCTALAKKEYEEKKKLEIKEYHKNYYSKNKEKILDKAKKRYKKKKEDKNENNILHNN